MTEQEWTKATEKEKKAELDRLRAENEALRQAKAKTGKLTLKVSEKGGVSLYGLGRFPVTLYREQWERVIQAVPEITAFLKFHASELSAKGDARADRSVSEQTVQV